MPPPPAAEDIALVSVPRRDLSALIRPVGTGEVLLVASRLGLPDRASEDQAKFDAELVGRLGPNVPRHSRWRRTISSTVGLSILLKVDPRTVQRRLLSVEVPFSTVVGRWLEIF